MAKLNLRGKSDIASPEELQAYESANELLKAELERRKSFGRVYGELLAAQQQLVIQREEGRCRHRVAISAVVREIRRTLQQFHTSRDNDDLLSQFDDQLRHRSVRGCVFLHTFLFVMIAIIGLELE